MKAFFADIKETGLMPDRGPKAWGEQLSLPSEEQRSSARTSKPNSTAAHAKLDEKAAALAANREAWERDLRQRWEAGKLAWTWQRPIAATALHGAKLTIYDDEPVDSAFYVDGSMKFDRKPGNGSGCRERSESGSRNVRRHVAAGRRVPGLSWASTWCRTTACRARVTPAARIASC